MKKLIIAVLISMMMVSVASAATVRQDCGCGLGGMALAQKEGLIWNLVGTFLNGICANQTFGMTSGTLDCGKTDKLVMNEQLNIYVADNMDALAVDIAQGQGEALDGLAEIAKVPSEKRAAVYTALQSNFEWIYPDAQVRHETVVENITEIINTI